MAEIQGDPWPTLAVAIGVVTASRAGIKHPDLLSDHAPGQVITALTVIIDAPLDNLPNGQADAVLRGLGLAALSATTAQP